MSFLLFQSIYAENDTNINFQNVTIQTEIQLSPEIEQLLTNLTKQQSIQNDRHNELEEKFNILIENFTKTLPDKTGRDWTEGDIIIASSAIFAFFTLGSQLTLKQYFPELEINNLLDGVSKSILVIQIIHLFAIIIVILDFFSPLVYAYIIGMTIVFLVVIFHAIRKTLLLSNRSSERIDKGNDFIKSALMDSGLDDYGKKYFDLKRDYEKEKRLAGE